MTPQHVDPRELADDLRALLERLEITAAVMDADGAALATTHEGNALVGDGAKPAHRQVSVQLCGHALTVAVRAEDESTTEARPLTARQRSVCELIASGLKNREIAEQLGISLHTVRRHVEALLARLRVSTRQEAVKVLLEMMEREGDSVEASSGPRRVA